MDRKKIHNLKLILDPLVALYNHQRFIAHDPICVPHLFTSVQDIEIAGFFAAIFSWGSRKVIIDKSKMLMQLMDNAPYQFICNYTINDLRVFENFKHRTFNYDDLYCMLEFLKCHYKKHISLESAFNKGITVHSKTVEVGLINFYQSFISSETFLNRTKKHISSPITNSSCKRLNMFLRWMVRADKNGVDFGIWKSISPKQLICPMDVHVCRVALQFGLISHPAANWRTAIELTAQLKKMDNHDPVKYDFALFGLGVNQKLPAN